LVEGIPRDLSAEKELDLGAKRPQRTAKRSVLAAGFRTPAFAASNPAFESRF
jgi:hypothetical protein